jgi:hypothetical protein
MSRVANGVATIVRVEPPGTTDVTVTVRRGDTSSTAVFDGVWIDGERAYDTYVIIDGQPAYHAPRVGVAEMSFVVHEQLGGGHAP